MADWSKKFNKNADTASGSTATSDGRRVTRGRSRKGVACSPSEPRDRLVRLTRDIEALWQEAAKDAENLERATADDVTYFGHESAQQNYSDIPSKDGFKEAADGPADTLRDSSAARRLRIILDAWCALWFWPLDRAAELPSWDDWLDAVHLVATRDYTGLGAGDLFSFAANTADPTRKTALDAFVADPTPENLHALYPFTAVAHNVAAAQRFLHWELDFADVFRRRGGFDIVIGNPPWVKPDWEESGVLSEYDPHIAIRKMAADKVAEFRDDVFSRKPAARTAYLVEYTATVGQRVFLSAETNYPALSGTRPNLYKFFLPLAFRIAAPQGVAGYVHPEGVYDDPKGGALRAEIYPRLRLHAQFRNTLGLFADIDGRNLYSLNVYGPTGDVHFKTIATLFHPSTLEASLAGGDETAPLPLERTDDGKWDLRGHPYRIVVVDEKALALFAALYDESGTPPIQARLPALYTQRFATEILPSILNAPRHLSDIPYGSTMFWNETLDRKNGTIKRETAFPPSLDEAIWLGPQFFVGNPLCKCPRPGCRSNGDYDAIDLDAIKEDYISRTNYARAIKRSDYVQRMPLYGNKTYSSYFRLIARRRVNPSNERTLIPCFAPKGVAHVNSVIEFLFDDRVDMSELTSTFGFWHSVPFDWFVRSTGKGDFFEEVARLLPVPPADSRVAARALLLNCLSKDYSELWAAGWQDAYLSDGWLAADPHLTPWADHLAQGRDWRWETPLRSALDRRQALVELDVLAARALGLSLDDLLLMYRVSFPTMRKYDSETFYDQKGRVVFTSLKGGGGLPNTPRRSQRNCTVLRNGEVIGQDIALGWKDVLGHEWQDQPGIEIRHTIYDQVLTDEPSPHTVTYVAPFFRKDREADYREVWEALDRTDGKA